MHRSHRLYWRIWFAVLASLAMFTLLAGGLWKFAGERSYRGSERAISELLAAVLPPLDAAVETQHAALLQWRDRVESELALYAPDGKRIAATADDVPAPRLQMQEGERIDWIYSARGPAVALRLPDGRVIVARRDGAGARTPFGLLGALALLALAVGVGAYPVARRLTRRLERLQSSVERLGQGDLTARVEVRGRDEVARLAESFNLAAARIEALVQSHRSLLANASHELRSPLARVRLAIEMLDAAQPERRARLKQDIAQGIGEIDALVEEILVAARLQATEGADPRAGFAEVDLLALVAEECARAEVELDGEPAVVEGDARLLRRLLRNLIDNAQRHGGAATSSAAAGVQVELRAVGQEARLRVHDRGPGIPDDQRESVFEPFYRLPGASEAGGGVGLGLALVKAISQRHGGHAACRPREGGGSTFEVVLPRAEVRGR
jgi:signal transduction histidine kinase